MNPTVRGIEPTIDSGIVRELADLSPVPDQRDHGMEVLVLLEHAILGARSSGARAGEPPIQVLSLEEVRKLIRAAWILNPELPDSIADLLTDSLRVLQEPLAALSVVEHSGPLDLGSGDGPGHHDPVQRRRDPSLVTGQPLERIEFGDGPRVGRTVIDLGNGEGRVKRFGQKRALKLSLRASVSMDQTIALQDLIEPQSMFTTPLRLFLAPNRRGPLVGPISERPDGKKAEAHRPFSNVGIPDLFRFPETQGPEHQQFRPSKVGNERYWQIEDPLDGGPDFLDPRVNDELEQ